MKIKKVRKYKILPPEVGVTYKTKFATNWEFKVTAIDTKSKNTVYGIYIGTAEDTGTICPINVERLILHTSDELVEEYSACPHCDKKIEL